MSQTTELTAPAADAADAVLRIGTRRSALALAQTGQVAAALEAAGARTELVPISTQGDTDLRPLRQIGGTGVFTSVLRAALLAGDVDIAVHSLKDLPTAPEPGLLLAAVPARADVRDVLVSRGSEGLAGLREGAVVGTGSARRRAQLLAVRPDLQVREIRGNVGTRLSMIAGPDGTPGAEGVEPVDAVVLAAAGLARLEQALPDGLVATPLDPSVFVPAPGQGALAVEVRVGDERAASACAALDHPDTRRCTAAERAVLSTLEAGCTAPVGAHAVVEADPGADTDTDTGSRLRLRAQLADLTDGTRDLSGDPDHPHRLGRHLAEELLRLRPQATEAHSQWAEHTTTERDT